MKKSTRFLIAILSTLSLFSLCSCDLVFELLEEEDIIVVDDAYGEEDYDSAGGFYVEEDLSYNDSYEDSYIDEDFEEIDENEESDDEQYIDVDVPFIEDRFADAELEGPYEFERVVDGDTIICYIDDVRTRVRMIGINTPESVAEEEWRNTEEGVEVSNYVKGLFDGVEEVYLEFDVERLDQYERTLAYVYIEDENGTLYMVNAHIVEMGYCELMFYYPNDRYEDLFEELLP